MVPPPPCAAVTHHTWSTVRLTIPTCLQEYPRALGALLAEIKQSGGSPEAHQRMQQLIAEGGRLRGSIAGKFSLLRTHACLDMENGFCMAHLDACRLSESSAAARQCTIQAACTGPSEPCQWHPCGWSHVGGCWMQLTSRLTSRTRSCRYCMPPCKNSSVACQVLSHVSAALVVAAAIPGKPWCNRSETGATGPSPPGAIAGCASPAQCMPKACDCA